MYAPSKFKSIESSLIYFLFQSFASLIFLISVVSWLFTFNDIEGIKDFFLTTSLIIKIGRAPFHY